MTQVWSNFVVAGGGGCNCCAGGCSYGDYLVLPPLTESTLDWYATCSDAATVITDQVSGCVGFIDQAAGTFSAFTATNGGSSLTLAGTVDNGDVDPRFDMWGSVMLGSGDVLTVAFSLSGTAGSPVASATLYDSTATLVEGKSALTNSGSLVFTAVSSAGRYIVRCRTGRNDGSDTGALSGSYTLTSSGTLTVNPVEAAYDVSAACPGLLVCGDSC